MANNLNEIARRTNAAEYSDAGREYLHMADRVDNLLNQLRHDR